MLTTQQLAMRKTGLGGSDIAAALGLSPWKTQTELWSEKTDPDYQSSPNAAMEWGSRLETPILLKFREEHPEFQVNHAGATVRDPNTPFLLATPDGFIVDRQGVRGILEVKTSGQQVWDSVPYYYILQAQHYCYVTGCTYAYFAVLFRGVEYREYGPIHYDPKLYEKEILPQLEQFWSCVESGQPEFDPTSLSDLYISQQLDDDSEPLVADLDTTLLVQDWGALKLARDQSDHQMKELQTELAKRMEEHKRLVDAEGNTLASQFDVKPSEYVDAKALKAAEPEIFDKFKKTRKGGRRMRIKP